MTRLVLLVLLAQYASPNEKLLSRRYVEGERLTYVMKGENDGSTYEVRLTAVAKKEAGGRFFEEYSASDFISQGRPQKLSVPDQEFRQAVTLQGGPPFLFPKFPQGTRLTGPILDLVTFYADLFLAIHQGELRKAGDRFYFANPATSSWADGSRVLIGEDAIGFDITLAEVDRSNGVAILHIKHVPPKEPQIKLPAEWMRKPVADSPNNWVQVVRAGDKYVASVGKETFDVELKIGLANGKILAATMENPVEKIARECTDAALADCGEPHRRPILRRIHMSLIE